MNGKAKNKIKKVCGAFAAAGVGTDIGNGIDISIGVSIDVGVRRPFSRPEVAYNFEPGFKWAAAAEAAVTATVTVTVTKTALSYATNGESGKTGDAWTIQLGSTIVRGASGEGKSV